MSEIVLTKCPISGDDYIAVWGCFGGQPLGCYHMTLKGTVDLTILESSPLSMMLAGKERVEIMQNEMFQMIAKTVGPGLQVAFGSLALSDNQLTEATFAQTVKQAEADFLDKQRATMQEKLGVRLDGVSVGSMLIMNSDDEVVYKWERGAAAVASETPWTCTYCGSTVTSKFCTNCGAPRH